MNSTSLRQGDVITYRVDAKDKLVYVSPSWLPFARDNKAAHLNAQAVLGCPLFQFIAGRGVRHLYELLMQRVRATRQPVVISFRCDGPAIRRFMLLTISRIMHNGLQFTSQMRKTQERGPIELLDAEVCRSEEWVTVCSWCKRVNAMDEWYEVEDAVGRLQLFTATEMPRLTHGMCPECAIEVRREAQRLR